MKINSLTASFGKLENDSLKFHDGLNLIYAPNESGKSTWCAFIQAMLYGVDTSERNRGGMLADKNKYIPWSGAPMEGSMDLTADGCDITIVRYTANRTAPMKEFSAYYTGTSEKVAELTGTNAGEELTGVTRDVFRRSAFIAQGNVAVSGSPELEKRISSIVSTGDEQTSFSEADERLRTWQRKRRYNNRGLLPDLEREIESDRSRLAELEEYRKEASALSQRLQAEKQQCARLETAVAESRKRQRKDSLEKLNAGRAALNARGSEHDEAARELALRKKQLSESCFGLRQLKEVQAEVTEDLGRLAELETQASVRLTSLPFILLLILSVACAALYTALGGIYFIIAAGLLCVAGCVLMFGYMKRKKTAEAAQTEKKKILDAYSADTAEDIQDLFEEFRALYSAAAESYKEERRTRAAYEEAARNHTQMEADVISELDFSSGTSEAVRLATELGNARKRVEAIAARLAELNGKIAVTGDSAALKSNMALLAAKHAEIEDEYSAIGLAMQVLKEADTELQSRFSPRLGRVAAEYMSVMTGGKYTEVMINRDFSTLARTADDTVARNSAYLSAGTMDLLYLAVRLAVCELAMPEGETCPLIIDDALVNLDSERYEAAMKLLREISTERQVIVFTCRARDSMEIE